MRRTTLLVAGAAATMALLVGCSGDGNSNPFGVGSSMQPPPPGSQVPSAPGTGTGDAATAESMAAALKEPCEILTGPVVAQALGISEEVKATVLSTPSSKVCFYNGASGKELTGIVMSPFPKSTPAKSLDEIKQEHSDFQPIDGLGDGAGTYVQEGSTVIFGVKSFQGGVVKAVIPFEPGSTLPRDSMIALMRQALGGIG